MKPRVFSLVMSVVVAVVSSAAVPIAMGAPQEQTIVVTSTADSGPGSLREALARATPGTTITFDPAVFPPDNPATIAVTSPLPELTQGQITIDGSNVGVILDGSRLPRGSGIYGLQITSSGNVIRGLQILDFPGDGLSIVSGAQNNTVGGDRTGGAWPTGRGNVISRNGENGIGIGGVGEVGASTNVIIGNYIGTDPTGSLAWGNNHHGVMIHRSATNTIGSTAPGERNVISGNELAGVRIEYPESMGNIIIGNYIGTDASGTIALGGNNHGGVAIDWGASENRIGGRAEGEGNIISGNTSDGVHIRGAGTDHNLVLGNFIGLDVSGTEPLPNSQGLSISDRASCNTVQGNVISGHQENPNIVLWDLGTVFNVIIGNLIGTDASGTVAIPSVGGVAIRGRASDNRIGGPALGEGNLISGNQSHGIDISWGSHWNQVVGNLIGTDISGTFAIPNGMGILIRDAFDNIIGGSADGDGNVISGNEGIGVAISGAESVENEVLGNHIGVDVSGMKPLGNLSGGVFIDEGAGPNFIGPGNIIAYNGQEGVRVHGPETVGNTVTANSIYENEGLGIENSEGGNAELPPPTLTYVGTRVIRGTAPPNSTVEVFFDEEDEGRVFEGKTIAGEEGNFTFHTAVGRFTGPNITATATDPGGNTSRFSPPESPPAPVVTRELPDILAPTQVSVEPKVVGTNLGLALLCVLFFGLTSTVFNSILVDYRDELLSTFRRLVPPALAGALDRVGLSFRGMAEKGRGRLLLMWLMVLLVTSLIESFLAPEVELLSTERLGILITLFISAAVVSALELGSDLYARRRLAPVLQAESKIQWVGIAIAVGCVILSRALDFKPGYLYGIVGAIYLMPRLADINNSGKRAVLVLLSIFAGGFILWIATAFLPATLAELEPLFLTIFLISLQGVFFGLFPLALTDGGDIWNWRRGVWFAFFSVVFFCFYHFLLNPNASDVQALQQNGVQTLLILMLVFGLATFTLWLLFPFRLGRTRASQS